ncbi:MAG: hypothetical protein JW938_05565 [Candidatus Omnitrophica bacterium]|nr:hypothetical protein [Candidatus Omnitrophota bacterium]
MDTILDAVKQTDVVQFFASDDEVIRFAFIGIIVLLMVYFIEKVLISGIKEDMRAFGKDVMKNATQAYLGTAWVGWLFVVLGFCVGEMAVLQLGFFSKYEQNYVGALLAVLSILVGILINFRSYCHKLTSALRNKFH